MSDNHYTVEVWGGCLGPAIPDGTQVVVDPTAEIAPLDLCAVVLRDGQGPWDKFMREAWSEVTDAAYPNVMAKIMLAKCSGMYLFGQLYPPCIGVVADGEIEAMHKIVGGVGREIKLLAGEAEREAFGMIAWCRGNSAVAPINPDWVPLTGKQALAVKKFAAMADALALGA